MYCQCGGCDSCLAAQGWHVHRKDWCYDLDGDKICGQLDYDEAASHEEEDRENEELLEQQQWEEEHAATLHRSAEST